MVLTINIDFILDIVFLFFPFTKYRMIILIIKHPINEHIIGLNPIDIKLKINIKTIKLKIMERNSFIPLSLSM